MEPSNRSDLQLLTIPQAAERLCVSTRTIYRLMDGGELPFVRLGRAIRISVSDLTALVDRQTRGGHNAGSAEPGKRRKEKSQCHTDAKTRLSGGRVTRTPVGDELDALLAPRTAGKRPH